VVRELVNGRVQADHQASATLVPAQFLAHLETLHASLRTPEFLALLGKLVALEESVYRSGHQNNYFADQLARCFDGHHRAVATYCTPPFRKFDDATATESWAYLFLPEPDAGVRLAQHPQTPATLRWNGARREIHALVSEDKFRRTQEIIRKISTAELMRFRIGMEACRTGRWARAIRQSQF